MSGLVLIILSISLLCVFCPSVIRNRYYNQIDQFDNQPTVQPQELQILHAARYSDEPRNDFFSETHNTTDEIVISEENTDNNSLSLHNLSKDTPLSTPKNENKIKDKEVLPVFDNNANLTEPLYCNLHSSMENLQPVPDLFNKIDNDESVSTVDDVDTEIKPKKKSFMNFWKK